MLSSDDFRPSHKQFMTTSRLAFSFLFDYGFAEIKGNEDANTFAVIFENEQYRITVRGVNWGYHARVHLHDINDGREAPISMFVPHAERQKILKNPKKKPNQLDDIEHQARIVQKYCVKVFSGDRKAFETVAKECYRITHPEYARSLQKRRLP